MNAGNRYVINRFLLKTAVLGAAASLRSREGAWRVAAVLFLLASALDALIALVRRHRPTDRSLTYWDEAAAFLLLSGLATAIAIGSSK
ncbi:hypothetical protein GCM10011380_36120 [Sphingomonas metalli]|uniref:Uncharacterized protein n=1 Tax=Sphingomonas metalli TaxID=1779358 RepID=A0A916TFM4_9SPHN|nr:hypothetical protein [Sphingomonas metalli]GGB43442.1 hypothetical protein GCM10011380_36120 [Sphingomonas metalli]